MHEKYEQIDEIILFNLRNLERSFKIVQGKNSVIAKNFHFDEYSNNCLKNLRIILWPSSVISVIIILFVFCFLDRSLN